MHHSNATGCLGRTATAPGHLNLGSNGVRRPPRCFVMALVAHAMAVGTQKREVSEVRFSRT